MDSTLHGKQRGRGNMCSTNLSFQRQMTVLLLYREKKTGCVHVISDHDSESDSWIEIAKEERKAPCRGYVPLHNSIAAVLVQFCTTPCDNNVNSCNRMIVTVEDIPTIAGGWHFVSRVRMFIEDH